MVWIHTSRIIVLAGLEFVGYPQQGIPATTPPAMGEGDEGVLRERLCRKALPAIDFLLKLLYNSKTLSNTMSGFR